MQVTVHPSLLEKKIIHIDMDAFYASVEEREDPSLVGKPVVVGGSPQSRGVVCTANYAARKFGIHSAMATAKAARLCPHAVFLRCNFPLYREVSHQIRRIFLEVTPHVEPLSLDEAYLDVTEQARESSATEIAQHIRSEILKTTQLTASAGVAPNKMLAKIASDLQKPNGLTVIRPEQVVAFMPQLSVRKIPGVGRVSAAKLKNLGVETCADVLLHQEILLERWATFGEWLIKRASGIDKRKVSTERVRKSLGHETTFQSDIVDLNELRTYLKELAHKLSLRLKKSQHRGRTITLKIKYADFTQITRSHSLSNYTDDEHTIYEISDRLLTSEQKAGQQIRLIGVALSNLQLPGESHQPLLFQDE